MIISVITPTLNCRRHVTECLDSVLAQSDVHVEHLIVDGGSVDGTAEVLRKYEAAHPGRIRVIWSQDDRGLGDAWTRGIKAAQGDILGWLGADDSYLPGVLSAVSRHFSSRQDIFVYGGYNLVADNGRVFMSCPAEPFSRQVLLNGKNLICTPSAFFRRELVSSVGYPDEDGLDLDYYLRLSRKYQPVPIGIIISNFRMSFESQTKGSSRERRLYWLRTWYRTSRRHGGSLFSGYSIRYHLFLLFGFALPVWNFIFEKFMIIFKRRLF